MSIEAALQARRSVREFRPTPLTADEIGQLLWATQGLSSADKRTAPSAGALYPLELYVATAEGMEHYEPAAHRLAPVARGDLRRAVFEASLRQEAILQAPALFVFAAVYARVERKYGDRAARYTHMDVGHAAQNLLLEATALGLAGVPIAAFDDEALHAALGLPPEQAPVYMVPVGRPRESAQTVP